MGPAAEPLAAENGRAPEALIASASGQDDDVLGHLPRYAIPNLASLLPTYTNAGQEIIHRTFHTGNYDFIKHLPHDIRFRQIEAKQTARRRLAVTASPAVSSTRPANTQHLFQTFAYESSPWDLEHQLNSALAAQSKTKQLAVAKREFQPSGVIAVPKHRDLVQQDVFYPYLGGAYNVLEEVLRRSKQDQGTQQPERAFRPPGCDKLSERPTSELARHIMARLASIIQEDWEDVGVSVFENQDLCWVVRFEASNVDSREGLAAYMNVLVRCNPLVTQYKLAKVPGAWNTSPEEDAIFFVLHPPWVHFGKLHAFYTLHPEEKTWQSCAAAQEAATRKPIGKHPPSAVTALGYDSRLKWGTNFMTNTPATVSMGRAWGW